MGVITAPALLRSPGVVRYLAAAGLARLADEMVGVAVVLLVIDRTGSTVAAGLTVMSYTLPSMLSGPVLGAWLDRARHPRLALAGNQVLLAAAMLGLVLAAGRAGVPVLCGLALLTGITLPLTSGGFSSLLPALVPRPLMARAQAADAVTFNTAALLGPAVAGGVAAAAGPGTAVAVISVAAALGALATVTLRLPRPAPPDGPVPPLFTAVRAGLAHLVRVPPLRGATLATMLSLGSVGLLSVALPLRVEQLGADRASAGFLWAAIEVGCLVSTLSLARHLDRWRPERVVFAGVALHGLALFTWPVGTGLPALVLLAVLAGLAQGPTLPSVIAARQRYTPAALLAQVSTTGASLKLGTFALGAALGGALAPVIGPTAVIALVAATQLAAALLGWVWSVWPASVGPGADPLSGSSASSWSPPGTP
ncbi:MFS transporter [Goodfellowiella coeruleoviolacea]|uniref:Arabinose efflux permease, MFS family n=1 Tax=Goodfellowiella coeruleoviolacea TaxID=334858 RepID=A0AAE3G8S7_9PSEU|nr:MFS transporter [Goodfellowiella coeruleoviolacea]MCP2163811.1 putative arabinose efflux permease, MFS family [Goodfellowiella coeruleoviolacea]